MYTKAIGSRLITLQCLRFLAAALVVFAHSVDAVQNVGGHPLVEGTTLENFGAIGVDVFFVISGFIITFAAQRSSSAIDFWRNRLLRVAPIYWLLSIPWIYFLRHDPFDPAKLADTLTFWPVYGKMADPFLPVGWTLSYEMLFYFAIGLTKAGVRPAWLVVGFFAAAFVRVAWDVPILQFLGNPIIFEFLFGVAIALYARPEMRGIALVLGVVGIAANLAFGYGAISEAKWTENASLSGMRVLVWGIPAALLVMGVVGFEERLQGRMLVFFALLGDASYSLYLSHPMVLHFVHVALEAMHFRADVTIPVTSICIAFGWFAYRYIETPLRLYLRSIAQRHSEVLPVLGANPSQGREDGPKYRSTN